MAVADTGDQVAGLTWEQQVGSNVGRIRKARNMTQDQLAAGMRARDPRLRMSQPKVAKIERADRPIRVNELPLLAAVLGVEVGDLLPEASGMHDPVRVAEEIEAAQRLAEAMEAAQVAQRRYDIAEAALADAGRALREAERRRRKAIGEAEMSSLRHARRRGA
jgi:transcriptional regulator with XRE-family HTH domain